MITTPTIGKKSNDLFVTCRDDKHRERDADGQKNGQILMPLQGIVDFRRTIGGGRQRIGTQTDPGQKGRERKVLEEFGIENVYGATKTG